MEQRCTWRRIRRSTGRSFEPWSNAVGNHRESSYRYVSFAIIARRRNWNTRARADGRLESKLERKAKRYSARTIDRGDKPEPRGRKTRDSANVDKISQERSRRPVEGIRGSRLDASRRPFLGSLGHYVAASRLREWARSRCRNGEFRREHLGNSFESD